MGLITLDPFKTLAAYIPTIIAWWKLLFSLAFSAVVSFLFVGGSVMVTTKSALLGVGAGMVMSALAMTVLFRRSPLTKGLTVVLPAEEAVKELETDMQVIEK